MTSVTARQRTATRGGMLGLILGDALGRTGGVVAASGTLPATSGGQLACFTVDGIIRAHVRHSHKGICHPSSVVWHATTRWAALQGIAGVKRWAAEDWPDGWLAQVPALAVRRGSAPATVAALRGLVMGSPDTPVGTSVGAHGLIRSLPVGLCHWWASTPGGEAGQVAAQTHAAEAVDAAALGASVLALVGAGQSIGDAAEEAQEQHLSLSQRAPRSPLTPALTAARSAPARMTELATLAPDARAMSTLAGAVYVAASLPEREQLREALLLAATAGDGGHVATVTGAFLGAAHGPEALPVGWVSRLELAWVADTLAGDLVREFADGPAGSEHVAATDPHWRDRYPGW